VSPLAPPRAWRTLALAGYTAVLLLATLTDFGFDASPDAVAARLQRALFVELNPRAVVDAVRNATLFAGWGLVWCLLAAPGARPRRQLALAAGTSALLSAAIEAAQLLSRNRTSSVLDVIVDVLGAALGVWAIQAILGWLVREPGAEMAPPAWLLAGSYAAAVLGEASIPLARQALAAHGSPRERLPVAWAAFVAEPWARVVPADVVLFLPAGVLAVHALRARGWSAPRASVSVTAVGALAMAAAELIHAPLGLRLGLAPVLVHAGAIALGALAAAAWPRRGAGMGTTVGTIVGIGPPALAAYALVLLAWDWRPFRLETADAIRAKLASDWWQPMMAQYLLGGDLYSVADVVIGFALFLPLGAWLARRPLAARGPLSAAWPAVWLAVAGELGQTVVQGRYLDITDPMVEAAGVLVGWLAMRQAVAMRPPASRAAAARGARPEPPA